MRSRQTVLVRVSELENHCRWRDCLGLMSDVSCSRTLQNWGKDQDWMPTFGSFPRTTVPSSVFLAVSGKLKWAVGAVSAGEQVHIHFPDLHPNLRHDMSTPPPCQREYQYVGGHLTQQCTPRLSCTDRGTFTMQCLCLLGSK
ncbi:hypothetical protein PAMP_017894 [Pampus punctatissimus]